MKTMKRSIAVFLFAILAGVAGAQTINVYPVTPKGIRIGGVQTVTAYVVGQNDKTVTWSAPDGGTIYGTNPCIVNEPCTAGLLVGASPGAGTYRLIATTNTGGLTATSTITFAGSPTPLTTYPRLGFTAAMLPALRAKATGTYYDQLKADAVTDYTNMNAVWSWSVNGGSGLPSVSSAYSFDEQSATLFAFMASIDPSDPTYKWGSYSSDILKYMVNFWLQASNTTVFPDRLYSDEQYGITGNHGSDDTEDFTFPTNWLIGSGNIGTGSGAAATATLTGTTMNAFTLSNHGTGYVANSTIYWYALVGSSACTTIGNYGSVPNGGGGWVNTGPAIAAMGTVTTDGSGTASGAVHVMANALNCTSPPTIIFKNDHDLFHDYHYLANQEVIATLATGTQAPVGGYNSPAQFQLASPNTPYSYGNMRDMQNNYTHSKHMYLVAGALTFNDNDTDDPPTPNTCSATPGVVCPDGTAYNLHAYFKYETGGMMYRDWAGREDPNVTWQAYQAKYGNLPTQPMCQNQVTAGMQGCFGMNRNGEPSEGNWYGPEHVQRLTEATYAIYTAGYDDPLIYGPQMSLMTSSWWDQMSNYNLGSLAYSYSSAPQWTFKSTGDSSGLSKYPYDFAAEGWLMAEDTLVGRSDRTSKLLWPQLNTAPNGISAFYSSLNSYALYNRIPLYLALPSGDVTASPPADPRPSLPTDTFSFNNQHITARSGWTSGGPISPTWGGPGGTATTFDFECTNAYINHEYSDCGAFSVLSAGEYVTVPRTIFSNYNYNMRVSQLINNAGYISNPSQTVCLLPNYPCQFVWGLDNLGGGQLPGGTEGGEAHLLHSELPTYVAAIAPDLQGLYNGNTNVGYGTINGVTAASRSLIDLRGTNQIVYYDRGSTGAHAYNKRLWINTTGTPTMSGSTGQWLTRSGAQKANFTSLLPSGATVSAIPMVNGIQLSSTFLNVHRGNTQTIVCTSLDADGSTSACDPSTVFYTGDPTIVSIDPTSGVMTAVAVGSTYIYAANNQGFNVSPPSNNINVVTGASSGSFVTISQLAQAVDWEPAAQIKVDAGTPTVTQFLSTLEWGSSSFSPTTATLVQSSAGDAFDGAKIGNTLVMFKRVVGTLTGVTYAASGATQHYVADLAPNTSYTISGTGAPSSATTDTAGVLVFSATGTGPITVGFAVPPPSNLTITISGALAVSGKAVHQ